MYTLLKNGRAPCGRKGASRGRNGSWGSYLIRVTPFIFLRKCARWVFGEDGGSGEAAPMGESGDNPRKQ